MEKKKCSFCGNYNEEEAEKCGFCNVPFDKQSELSDLDKEKIGNYIKGLETKLENIKYRNRGVSVVNVLLLLGVTLFFKSYLNKEFVKADLPSYEMEIYFIPVIVLIFILIIYTITRNKSRINIDIRELKSEIKEYLYKTGYTMADFIAVAKEKLNENNNLLKFI